MADKKKRILGGGAPRCSAGSEAPPEDQQKKGKQRHCASKGKREVRIVAMGGKPASEGPPKTKK
jgi:hypothetical protein